MEKVQGRAPQCHFNDFSFLASAFWAPYQKVIGQNVWDFLDSERQGQMFLGTTENLKSFPGNLFLLPDTIHGMFIIHRLACDSVPLVRHTEIRAKLGGLNLAYCSTGAKQSGLGVVYRESQKPQNSWFYFKY